MSERTLICCILGHDLLFPKSQAEHIMAMPATQRRWTASEVRQLIVESPLQTPRYELVDGELLVTPSPSAPHQRAVALLWRALEDYLAREPAGVAYVSPFDLELEPGTIVQPDVFVVPPHESERLLRGELPGRELMLAVEILSPGSGRHDRVTKRYLYGRHVDDYWVVDLDARLFERWRRAAQQPDVIVSSLEWLPLRATEPFRLDLPGYFAAVFGETHK
jgi:Uma2 family endonuclease